MATETNDADLNILIVDDAPPMRKILAKMLYDMGYRRIKEAGDGSAAQKILWSEPIDCVICDWNMPVMSGIDFLKAVRADPRFAQLPFIMVTVETRKERVVEALRSGVSNYMVKPFNQKVLKDKMHAALASSAA